MAAITHIVMLSGVPARRDGVEASLLRQCRWPALVLFASLVLVFVLPSSSQIFAKRLILKDGTYQSATKWEIQGDHVHYYSAERYEWEDLPASLVDWPATNKYNQQIEQGKPSPEAAQLDAEYEKEQQQLDAQSPQVLPGLRLPPEGGVFMVDTYAGLPQLIELVQSGGELNKNTGKNMLRAMINPLAVAQQTIELPGLHARVQAHETTPVIYADVKDSDSSPDSVGQPSSAGAEQLHRYRVVRMKEKKDDRVIGDIKIAITGKVHQQQDWVDTTAEQVAGGDWVKITPAQPLAPGEYALVEMLGDKQMNLYVWDFGVDPKAPANPTAWKPVQPPKNETGTQQSPVLTNRPPV